LYRPQFSRFADYLEAKWARFCPTYSTWRQWRASYLAYLEAHDVGAILHNEHTARLLRVVEQNARRLVATLAKDYSEDGLIHSTDICRAAEVVADVLECAAIGGFVDTGDGSMTAIGAAVETATQERIMRQRQHIADGMKSKGWSASEVCYWGGYDNTSLPYEWAKLAVGTKIEIKWRLVDKDSE
jgi:hypothetical protein